MFQELDRHQDWNGIPRVDGAINCTHIKILVISGQQFHEVFRNKKFYF